MRSKHLIDQTKQLMCIPSTSDNLEALREAVEFVAAVVAKCPGVTIERFERSGKLSFLAYRGSTRPDKFDILLNGHVDVVPAHPSQFEPVVRDGKLYGRGALDMKGTTMVLVDVFCKQVNVVPYNLGLQIVCDEEVGGYDCTRHQIDSGVRADFVLVGEYSNEHGTIYNAARGICWAEVAFKGKASHGGHPWNGTNAVVKAEEFAAAVLKRYPTPDRETWTTTASIANLSTPNEAFNKVPDRALLRIDFRFTQENPVFESEGSLRAFIASIDPDAELVQTVTFEPAVNVEELNPYVQGLSAATTRVTDKPVQFKGRPGGSDGRHYALVNNDVVEFGLHGQHSHSDDEFVELSSFDEYHDILSAFLAKPIPENTRSPQAANEPLHLQILRKLTAMPTVSGDQASIRTAMAYVEHYLESRGMHIARFERHGVLSIVATTKPGDRRPKVLLNTHIDVAPATDDLFQLSIAGDMIHGRGVADTKFALASYMALVDRLKDRLADYSLGIMVTGDGKIGSQNGAKVLVGEEGYRPKVAVIPTGGDNWELETHAKGLQWIQLSAHGINAHASRPWKGDNAIDRLLGALSDIRGLTPDSPGPDDTFITIGTISGGTVTNQLADHAHATLDVRTATTDDHKRIAQSISKLCAKHDIECVHLFNDPPSTNNPASPLIRPFVDAVTRITGEPHQTSRSLGMTEGRFFNAAHIPCVIVRPPAGDLHRPTEWLSRKGFDQFQAVVEQYVQDVALLPTRKPAPATAVATPKYVWYATYGSGLSYDNFMHCLHGRRIEGCALRYDTCPDTTPPTDNLFIALPYRLYFAGDSIAWPGGGLGTVSLTQDEAANTIARIYRITMQQFEHLAAQENAQPSAKPLPIDAAMQHGYAPLGFEGPYNTLLFCGERGGEPIFTLTADRSAMPHTPPSDGYTQSVLKGLSENTAMSTGKATQYIRIQHRAHVVGATRGGAHQSD